MKIGIDALFIRPGKNGGTESYLRNLLKGLEEVDDSNEYYIFTSTNNDDTFQFLNPNFTKVICDVDGNNKFKRVLFSNFKLPSKIKSLKLDVMFFPTYIRCFKDLGDTVTVSNIQDIQYKHYPEYFSVIQKLIFNVFYPLSLRKSDRVICISEHVKNDLISNFAYIKKDKLQVIHNAIDFEKLDELSIDAAETSIEQKYGLSPKNYILSVAALSPHKNIDTLVAAFVEFREIHKKDMKLVLVGVSGRSANDLREKVSQNRYKESIIIPGFIEDDMLALLYDQAALFVSTSLFEGFGMPPVEAMYKRIPTITTKCTSLPEVTMGKAVYYDNPLDAKELSLIMNTTINTPPHNQYLEEVSDKLRQSYSLETIAYQYKSFFEKL